MFTKILRNNLETSLDMFVHAHAPIHFQWECCLLYAQGIERPTVTTCLGLAELAEHADFNSKVEKSQANWTSCLFIRIAYIHSACIYTLMV
jgi:hypothetical protein